MKTFIGIILLIPFLIWGTLRTVNAITYNIDCGGHLKRAADANTVEMAKKELITAIKYLQDNNMTAGYTSVLYRTPDEDIEFWYTNLNQSLGELSAVTNSTSQLEKSNILMKLRETLLDQNKDGTSVTQPAGISIFPKNKIYALFGGLSALFGLVGCVLIFQKLVDY